MANRPDISEAQLAITKALMIRAVPDMRWSRIMKGLLLTSNCPIRMTALAAAIGAQADVIVRKI